MQNLTRHWDQIKLDSDQSGPTVSNCLKIIEQFLTWHKPILMNFIEIKHAFDWNHRISIWQIAAKCSIPHKIVNIKKNFYHDSISGGSMSLKRGNMTSAERKSKRGGGLGALPLVGCKGKIPGQRGHEGRTPEAERIYIINGWDLWWKFNVSHFSTKKGLNPESEISICRLSTSEFDGVPTTIELLDWGLAELASWIRKWKACARWYI